MLLAAVFLVRQSEADHDMAYVAAASPMVLYSVNARGYTLMILFMCLLVLLALITPRLVVFLLWLFTNWFRGIFDTLLWPILGFLILPWTTLAYIFVFPGGLTLLDWVILAIALLIDLGSHGGGGRAYRRRYVSDY